MRTHKFGICVPKSVAEVKGLDKENGGTLSWDVIFKEMKNVQIPFGELEGDKIQPGYQEIRCRVIFDVKMGENFRRKAGMVAGDHRNKAPSALSYSSVVSRNSVVI